jgi:hypothetical protein
MIRFACEHCQKNIQSPDEYAGKRVRCPHCGQGATVPGAAPPEVAPRAYSRVSTPLILMIVGGLLAVAVVVVYFVTRTVEVVVVEPARQAAKGVSCQNNLKQIATALKAYATNNRSLYPSLYSRGGTKEAREETWGSDAPTSETMYLIDDIQDRNNDANAARKLEDVRPMTSNLHCLWMLVRSGACTAEVFVCPDDPDNTLDASRTPEPSKWWNFEYLTDCSYSYQNQLGRTTDDNKLKSDTVIAADKSPGRIDAMDRSNGSDPWYKRNSPNHGGEGQYVLCGDGSVTFTDTPYCGRILNNIWIREKWDRESSERIKWLPTDDVTIEDCCTAYDKGLADPNDSWLVP